MRAPVHSNGFCSLFFLSIFLYFFFPFHTFLFSFCLPTYFLGVKRRQVYKLTDICGNKTTHTHREREKLPTKGLTFLQFMMRLMNDLNVFIDEKKKLMTFFGEF